MTQITHNKGRLAPGSIPHERTSFDTARKIRKVLEPQASHEQKDKLHQEDEDTTWFGIVREDAELPLFQDYGRYARIMADTQTSSLGQGVGTHDHRFPSLVSFVGQTGLYFMSDSKRFLIGPQALGRVLSSNWSLISALIIERDSRHRS